MQNSLTSPSSPAITRHNGFSKVLEIFRNLMGSNGSNQNACYDSDGGNSRLPFSPGGGLAVLFVFFLIGKGFIKPDHDHAPYSSDPHSNEQQELDYRDQKRRDANNPRNRDKHIPTTRELKEGRPSVDFNKHFKDEIKQNKENKRSGYDLRPREE